MDIIWKRLKKGKPWKGEIKLLKKDGSTPWTEAGISPLKRKDEDQTGYTVIYQDVSRRKHYERLAVRDELTGLYNRRHFNTIAPRLLKTAETNKQFLAFLLMPVFLYSSIPA